MLIDMTKMSDKQKNNFSSAVEAYESSNLVSSQYPPVLFIELTRNCIAKCGFCHGRFWKNKNRYNMNDSVFDELLRRYIPYALLVDLRGWGESLMLEKFPDYLNRIAQFKPKLRITTTLGCGNKKSLQSLIDHDVFISVSFDAANKALYEKIRKGIKYDTVLSNIKFLTDCLLKKYGSLKGRFRLGVVPFQYCNLSELSAILDFAASYQIQEVRLSPLISYFWDTNLLKHHKNETIETLLQAIDKASKLRISLQLAVSPFEELRIPGRAFDRCCHPWMYALVSYSGTVGFCDHLIPQRRFNFMANIMTDKESFWNNKKFRHLREAHLLKNKKALQFQCQYCYRLGRYADHEHDLYQKFSKWNVGLEELREHLKFDAE